MASLTTRALLLGVVSLFEPANGYQLRRELLSWGVEYWAHIKPGSIYSMLTTFARQGFIERHDLPEGDRTVAVYTMADAGRDELRRLLREAAVTVNAMDPSGFRVALSLAPLVDRHDMVAALREREVNAARISADLLDKIAVVARGMAPPHVSHSLELELRLVETERAWLADYLAAIEAGGLTFAGEAEPAWSPPDDDAGWQMVRESQRYREQIDAEKG
ncbi:PadR family transcriptional regulator [Herbiconiux daphne]|uniref:PadR family transcriptional regulator n=1 Tax=Herbiconiux daphne TaxID=2970914 RepID=A0ABT2H387_9MICO|nr:PadR family transcriptional regulator [Herbiconiux daphne]MCS5734414.1 PadR family transcriptional regulator [Herbiconiux daphne]